MPISRLTCLQSREAVAMAIPDHTPRTEAEDRGAPAYEDFAAALKEDLRDFHRADLLARNPLLRDGLWTLDRPAGPLELKGLLTETVSTLFGNARDEKLRSS
jgi:hypothetical protein